MSLNRVKLINILAVLASFLFGCSKPGDVRQCSSADSISKAVEKLTAKQKSELETWSSALVKSCKIADVFPSLSKHSDSSGPTNGAEEGKSVDLKKFLTITGNSLVVKNEKDPSEMVFFSGFTSNNLPAKSTEVSCEQSGAQAPIEVKVAGTGCEVMVGGQVLYSTQLAPAISVTMHIAQEKTAVVANLPQNIPAGTMQSKAGYISLQSNAFTQPVSNVLGVNDIMRPNPVPEKPEVVAYPTRQRIYELLRSKFSELDSKQLEEKFPLAFGGFENMWAKVTPETAEVLGDVAVFSNSQSAIIGEFNSELSELWDGSFSNKKFNYSFNWHADLGRVAIGSLKNDKDPKTAAFKIGLSFDGSIKKGGKVSVTEFTYSGEVGENPADLFKNCAENRLTSLSALHNATDERPNVGYHDIIGPCQSIVGWDLVAKTILADLSLRQKFLSAVSKVVQTKSNSYPYPSDSGWSGLLHSLIALLPLNSNKFLIELNAPSSLQRVLAPAQARVDNLLEKISPSKENYELRLATINTVVRWSFSKNTVSDDVIKDLRKLIDRFYDYFKVSTIRLIQQFGVGSESHDLHEAKRTLKFALAIEDAFIKRYFSLKNRAREIGALAVFTNFENNAFNPYQNVNFLDEWERVMELAHKKSLKARAERSRSHSKVTETEFETSRVAILEMSIREGWKSLTFENFEKLTELAIFIPSCSSSIDAISRAACVGANKFSSVGEGLLDPVRRDYILELVEQLKTKLRSISNQDPMLAAEIARGFYGPFWAGCSKNEVEVRKIAFDHFLEEAVKGNNLSGNIAKNFQIILRGCRN